MKDYGLDDLEQMEQVSGLYVGTGFYIYEKLGSSNLIECILP